LSLFKFEAFAGSASFNSSLSIRFFHLFFPLLSTEGIIMKNVIRILTIGAAALTQFSIASAEAPIFYWEQPGYQTTGISEKSRAEVKAELIEARSSGTLAVSDHDYPMAQEVADNAEGKTRAEVRAEAIEARRLGVVQQSDAQMPVATQAQLAAIELAGLRATQTQVITSAQ
jgi:Domain of unknown function (DUF4148)